MVAESELRVRPWRPVIVASATCAFVAVVTGSLGKFLAAGLVVVAGVAAVLFALHARPVIDARGVHHVGLFGDSFSIPWEDALGVAVDSFRDSARGDRGHASPPHSVHAARRAPRGVPGL